VWSQKADHRTNKNNLASKALADYLKAHTFINYCLEVHVKSTFWQFNLLPPSGYFTNILCIMLYYEATFWIHLWHGQWRHSTCLLLYYQNQGYPQKGAWPPLTNNTDAKLYIYWQVYFSSVCQLSNEENILSNTNICAFPFLFSFLLVYSINLQF